MVKRSTLLAQGVFAFCLVLLCVSLESFADETDAPVGPPIVQPAETNSEELLQAVLQLQGQLRSNQLAIEENARTVKEAAAQNAEALSNGLQKIENAFSAQQEDFSARSVRELEALQTSNHSLLTVAGAIAAIAFLAMLITGYFQWRTSKAWAEVSTLLPAPREGIRGSPVSALGISGQPLVSSGSVEDSSLGVLGAIEKLKKRIQTLEQSFQPALRIHSPASVSEDDKGLPAAMDGPTTVALDQDAQIASLLRLGQSRLKENDLQAALNFFDRALSLNPNQGEALVKKGATLERLKRLPEAFEYYDRAIAANSSLTAAYLHKGGLYNRLERFKEALECYEKALQTQEECGD